MMMLLSAYCRFQVWIVRQEGSSMVEWMVLAVLIVVGLFATVKALRDALKDQFCSIITTINPDAKCGG